MQPSDFPLAWPEGRSRTPDADRVDGRFRMSFENAYDALFDEAERIHDDSFREFIISTNVPLGRDARPLVRAAKGQIDPGVCLYVWREGRLYALACDVYREVRHNLRAICLRIQALRTIQRHPTSALMEQSTVGFALEVEAAPIVHVPLLAANGVHGGTCYSR